MTYKQAAEKAKELWGFNGGVESNENSSHPEDRYRVGCVNVMSFEVRGRGATWEEAFAAAEQRSMDGDRSAREHEKLHAILDKSQAIREFLDWLNEQGIVLARYHQHDDECLDDDGRRACGFSKKELCPEWIQKLKLLTAYFNIDMNKLEDEKREKLARLQVRPSTDTRDQLARCSVCGTRHYAGCSGFPARGKP